MFSRHSAGGPMITHTPESAYPLLASVIVPVKRVMPAASVGSGVFVGPGLAVGPDTADGLGVSRTAAGAQAPSRRASVNVTASARPPLLSLDMGKVVVVLIMLLLVAGMVPARASAAAPYTVSGHVTDSGTGQPLTGACIIIGPLVPCAPNFPHSDATGFYTVDLPAASLTWTFNFAMCDYAVTTKSVSLTGNKTVDAALTRNAPAKPPPLGGTPTDTVYLPNITKTLGGPNGYDTPFIAQNVGSAATQLEVSYFRFSDGCLVTRRTVSGLAAGTSFADIPNNDVDLPNDTQFSVVIRSFGASIVSVVNEIQGSGASFQGLSYTGSNTGATKVYLPNVTRRFYGYDVPFIVQNLGTATASALAHFVSFDGSLTYDRALLIAPGRSAVVDPNYEPGYTGAVGSGLRDQTQYAVTVTSDQPVAVVVNAYNDTGNPVAYSHNGLATGAATLYGPYAAKGADGVNRFSPIVVQNVGTNAVAPTLAFTPLGGGAVQTFTGPTVQPGSSWAFDPRFTLGTTTLCSGPSATCLGAGSYSVVISASGGQIAAVILPVSDATAMAYSAAPTVTTRQYLPNVTRTLGGASGYTTPILLQSAGATSATLRWYRFSDGSLVTTTTHTLPSGGAVAIDPRSVGGLSDDTQYAVVADGTGGSITAIVEELAFSGGDAAMIYEGFAR